MQLVKEAGGGERGLQVPYENYLWCRLNLMVFSKYCFWNRVDVMCKNQYIDTTTKEFIMKKTDMSTDLIY